MARILTWGCGGVVFLAALLFGARDLWAAALIDLLTAGLLAALVAWSAWDEKAPRLDVSWLLPLGLVAAAVWTSYAGAANRGEAWSAAMDWTAALALFFTAVHVFEAERAAAVPAELAAGFAALTLAVVSRQRWLEVLSPPGGLDTLWRYARWFIDIQSPGTLRNAGTAAGFTLIWLPALYQQSAGRPNRLFRAAGFALSLVVLLQFNSFWATFCLCGMAAVIHRRQLRGAYQRHPRPAAAVAGALALLAAALLWSKLTRQYDLTGHPVPLTARMSRLAWWSTGLAMWRSRPWLGIGPGNFGGAFAAFRTRPVQATLFAHSLPVSLLAETGLCGLLSVGVFAVFYARRLKARLRDGDHAAYALGAFGLIAHGLTSVAFEYLAILLAAALALGVGAATSRRPGVRPPRWLALLLPGLLLLALPWITAPFLASRQYETGRAKLKEGNFEAAVKAFSNAAEIDPRSFEPEKGLAEAHFARFQAAGDSADLKRAVEHQVRAVERNQLNVDLRRELAAYQEREAHF